VETALIAGLASLGMGVHPALNARVWLRLAQVSRPLRHLVQESRLSADILSTGDRRGYSGEALLVMSRYLDIRRTRISARTFHGSAVHALVGRLHTIQLCNSARYSAAAGTSALCGRECVSLTLMDDKRYDGAVDLRD